MKYDIEKEEQQFMNFINDQTYNVYKEIDNIYRDYAGYVAGCQML